MNLDPNAPFDITASDKAIGDALVSLVTLSFRQPGEPIAPEAGQQFFEHVKDAIFAGSMACGEIKRLRADMAAIRDAHRPRPHADPSAPGALCEACSLHGALVSWPCATWTAVDRSLTHGQH